MPAQFGESNTVAEWKKQTLRMKQTLKVKLNFGAFFRFGTFRVCFRR